MSAPDPPTDPLKARPDEHHTEGFGIDPTGEEEVDRKLAALEMAGEEAIAGWKPADHVPLAPEVRFLHSSRTIHQLVTDRNRSVGIFLFVASLLITASTSLIGAKVDDRLIVPLATLQFWCLPVTFATLAILGAFMSLILIRTRIGLIYEVAKMNAMLGLPSERVKRVNPLSIFFLMHLMVVVLGGASAGLAAGMLIGHLSPGAAVPAGVVLAFAYIALFQASYYWTILRATSETKLREAGR